MKTSLKDFLIATLIMLAMTLIYIGSESTAYIVLAVVFLGALAKGIGEVIKDKSE